MSTESRRVFLVLTLKLGGGEVTANERTRVRVREKWRLMSHFSWVRQSIGSFSTE
ncbi:uncharacterized protein BO88DRAFT_400739 [Aspergillus vadensis CBS 113365]|uniref:Uncharacterized protein n=1 Tax=Aspergillus vadensis (strain CBS 113365 / IMI 142717 / IBT 24658) TaxID=1448311 RepID=A0A319BP05_ASPVC|nr:hypothetical protein BO88DRAFT_400739 [Aspergillus vadensis CBS 113365]PYH75116.1 hypothetical protein BO88DRAFT_400739 [Aspergillus vadensis CBS 113365]